MNKSNFGETPHRTQRPVFAIAGACCPLALLAVNAVILLQTLLAILWR